MFILIWKIDICWKKDICYLIFSILKIVYYIIFNVVSCKIMGLFCMCRLWGNVVVLLIILGIFIRDFDV